MASQESKAASAARGRTFVGLEEETEWAGPFHFVQMADTQLGMFKENNERDNWDRELDMMRLAISKINAMTPAPKFVVCCGDLTDAWLVGGAECY